MKTTVRLFTLIYRYAMIIVVASAPLLFIPKIGFSGDVSYHIVMAFLVALALLSYVVVAFLTRTWHSVSRFEFIGYFTLSLGVLLSVIFSKNPGITLFGDAFNQFSGAALLSLPVVMYLTRALPESLRHKLKVIILVELLISSFLFVMALIYGGHILTFTRAFFSSFSNTLSFSIYMGLFVVAAFFYVKKAKLKKRFKLPIVIVALLFCAWILSIASQNSVRPNLASTLLVGKHVLFEQGIFGIGAGNFATAWQLYKPQDVINSPYFGYDFVSGADTISTLFVTVGVVGVAGLLILGLAALVSTFRLYRKETDEKEHFILGLVAFALLYFVTAAFLVPLSYSMLVMWMIIAGLGVAKTKLTEFHPSKKLAYLLIPILGILIVNAHMTAHKVKAFSLYNKAQTVASLPDAESLVTQAAKIYPFDAFYRLLVEYAITENRNLASTQTSDQEAFKNAYLKKAQSAVDLGLYAVKLNPHNYDNYVSLGRAYELALPFDKEGAFSNAKKSYEEAVRLYPSNPYLYVMLARLENSAGSRDAIRGHLTDALKKKQNFADALYLLSQLSASENKLDEALTYAIEAVKSAPNDPAVYTQAGLLLYGKKDYANAVAALKTALEKDQNNANIAYFLALALRDGGRADLAKPLADELMRRNPGNADLAKFVASLTPLEVPQIKTQSKTTSSPKR